MIYAVSLLKPLILAMVLFSASSPQARADRSEGDQFGDPFGSSSQITDKNSDFDDTDGKERQDEATPVDPFAFSTAGIVRDRSVEISGELSYRPTIFVERLDDSYREPEFVSTSVSATIRIESTFGRTRFVAAFKPSIQPGNPASFAIEPLALSAGYRGNAIDLEAGVFPLEWSAMNAFRLTDFFEDDAVLPLPALGTEATKPLLAGVHALFYLGPAFFELVAAPVYSRLASRTPTKIESRIAAMLLSGDPVLEIRPFETAPVSGYAGGEFAARIGGSIGPLTLAVLGYHGYRKTQSISVEGPPESDPYVAVRTEYPRIDSIGASINFEVINIIVNAEATLSFDAPIAVLREQELPFIGIVTDRLFEPADLFTWSAGIEWELIRNVRLIAEYTDSHLFEEIDHVEAQRFPGDKAFAALDVIVPFSRSELGLTGAAVYDWSGGELSAIGAVRLDLYNGMLLTLTGLYFDLLEPSDATTDLYYAIEQSMIFELGIQYSY